MFIQWVLQPWLCLFLDDNVYGELNSVLTTEAEYEEDKIEMETEFSEEDDEDEYYYETTSTKKYTTTTPPPVTTAELSQEESGSTEQNYYYFEDQTEEEESSVPGKYSVIDQIIEEEQKTPGEKLLEKIDKSKILERILPQTEEPGRDSLLSKIIRMFGK